MSDQFGVAIIAAIGLIGSALVTTLLAPRTVRGEKKDAAEGAVDKTLDEDNKIALKDERIAIQAAHILFQDEQLEAKDDRIKFLEAENLTLRNNQAKDRA